MSLAIILSSRSTKVKIKKNIKARGEKVAMRNPRGDGCFNIT